MKISKKNGKLAFELDALNSYDVPVHIVYEASSPTVVDNLSTEQVDSHKKIVNGQLMIMRNGKAYNAQGAQVD
jgi:hypothetical protein